MKRIEVVLSDHSLKQFEHWVATFPLMHLACRRQNFRQRKSEKRIVSQVFAHDQ